MPADNQDELFYWVDENDQVLGSISRRQAHSDPSKIHRSVFIILSNSLGQVLLQKRSLKKDTSPGKWTVAASGHVTYGLSYEEAAEKELLEEIGVKTPLTLLAKHHVNIPREQEIASIFTGQIEFTPTQLDPDEVDSVKWVTVSELKMLEQQNELTPMAINILHYLNFWS